MNHPTGVIRRFGSYSEAQIKKMKEDLSLSLSEKSLTALSAYYRTQEKRDPLIFELQLLDALAKKPKATVSTEEAKINRLFVKDAFVEQTYADLIEKRKQIFPSPLKAPTLSDCLHTATAYARAVGKPCEQKGAALRISTSDAEDGIGISTSPHKLCFSSKSTAKAVPQNGDPIFLLLADDGESPSADALEEFFSSLDGYKSTASVSSNGLPVSLMEHIRSGFWLDLSALANQKEITTALLTDAFLGCRFVCISAKEQQALVQKASEHGINACKIATVACYNRIIFTMDQKDLFSLPIAFLRDILFAKQLDVELPHEGAGMDATIAHQPTSESHCRYLHRSELAMQSEITVQNGIRFAGATSNPTESFYKAALYTALCPIVSLSASGSLYPDLRLSVGLTASKNDEQAVSEALSVILGLYRVQSELGTPAATACFSTDQTAKHPTLTVFASAQGALTPNKCMQEGSRICCLTPALDENGLPDFPALRAMLQSLTAQAQNGEFFSTRVLCNESIRDGLKLMSHGKLVCQADESVDTSTIFPLAILLECKADDTRYAQIATVRATEDDLSFEAPKLPALSSLIWSPKTEFVLLCNENDIDAQVLAEFIKAHGGNVQLFTATPDRTGVLSRAILTSHVLVLCDSVSIPDEEHVRFATDTLLRAGGICISVGELREQPFEFPIFKLSNGFAEETLMELIK